MESKVATTTAFKDIVPTVFECDVRCCDEVGEVDRRLEAVLARLVSDYRAIFVIEEEVEGGARFVYKYLDASRYFGTCPPYTPWPERNSRSHSLYLAT